MHKASNNTKVIQSYMESLAIHTGAPTVNFEDSTSFIYFVEARRVIPRVEHIHIPVDCLQEIFDNGIFVPKYEMSSVIPAYMCPKPCLGPIISQSTKLVTGFRLYLSSDTEHYQIMRLHEFLVK